MWSRYNGAARSSLAPLKFLKYCEEIYNIHEMFEP